MIIEIHEGDRQWSDDEVTALELPPKPTVQALADALHAKGYRVNRAAGGADRFTVHVSRLGPAQPGGSRISSSSTMAKRTDNLRRDDMHPVPSAGRARRPRKMWAVMSEGRDHGAYLTPEEAQAVADKMPDGYITECMRVPGRLQRRRQR